MKYFFPEYLLGWESSLEARTTRTFYYVIKARLKLKFVTKKDTYTIKQHQEIFPAQNIMEMKESIQYQRSSIENEEAVLDRSKADAMKYYVDEGDTYGPGCSWL